MSLIELLSAETCSMQQRDKIYGVVVGIVRDIKDRENLGRVKLDYPWLAEEEETVAISSEEDRAHSPWARVATLMAGNGYGSYVIPEVGTEVLVAFEHGDVDRPYVVGALWNAEDPPPVDMDGEAKNHLRSITSRSGHRIVLDDSDDKPSITIVDNTGENSITIDSANNAMEINVSGDLTINVGGNLNITAEGKVTIKARQDISAQTQANLEVTAAGGGLLETTGSLAIKSSATLTAESTAQTEVKGNSVSVNGSAMTEVKGAMVKIN